MPAMQFVWYQLETADIDAALAFYGPLLGWETQEFPGGGPRYAIISAKGRDVGGVTALPAGTSQPAWLGYIGTPNIDDTLARFTASGGTMRRAAWETPGVGRLALVADPQGAGLALIQGASDQPSEAFDPQRPGHGSWHELYTTDPASAFAFYAAQFGWTKGDAIDMGPMGTYQIFKFGDVQAGGMMKAQGGERPAWRYFFGVPGVGTAVSRIKDTGGAILREPSEVPGGALIVHAKDPQGALFALVGPA